MTIPEVGVIDLYGFGLKRIRPHFWTLLASVIVFILFGMIEPALHGWEETDFSPVGLAYQILVIGPVTFGLYYVFLKAARDDAPQVGDVLQGFRNYGNVIIANLLMTMAIGIGALLLIVPGIILACRLILTPYLVTDRGMTAVDALKESWRLTTGHGWTVFFMLLLAMPIVVAGLAVFGVGVLFSLVWIGMAFAALYVGICDPQRPDARPMEGLAA